MWYYCTGTEAWPATGVASYKLSFSLSLCLYQAPGQQATITMMIFTIHINKHLHLTHSRIIQVKPFTLSASEYKGKALTFSLAITWDLQILTSSLLFSLLNIYSNLQSANTERVRELRDKFGQNHGPRWLMIRNVMSLYSDLYYRINLTASSHKPLN